MVAHPSHPWGTCTIHLGRFPLPSNPFKWSFSHKYIMPPLLYNLYYMVFVLYPNGYDLHPSFMDRNSIFYKLVLLIPLLVFMLLYQITTTPTKRSISLIFNLFYAI